jgi:hypothetical protein
MPIEHNTNAPKNTNKPQQGCAEKYQQRSKETMQTMKKKKHNITMINQSKNKKHMLKH